MTITGLNNNHYLINNEINIIINGVGASEIRYLEVKATNSFNLKIKVLRFYPINNVFKFDVSSLVKSLFDKPNNDLSKNLNSISLEFKSVDINNVITTTTISKYFIRGGNLKGFYPSGSVKQNYLKDGMLISELITKPVPVWNPLSFYDLDLSIIDESYEIGVNLPKIEVLENPCNGIYVKFLNQYGTYSYWFFNSFENNSKTKKLDLIKNFNTDFDANNFTDLGVTIESSIILKTEIPKRFNNLMLHLIISPEVYFLDNTTYRKIKQISQKHSYNPIEKIFDYKFEFELDNILNPSLLC